MDWNAITTEFLLGLVGLVFTFLGAYVTYLINKHIKDEELKTTLNSLHETVRNSVLEVYQIYVEGLKDAGMFDGQAQAHALDICVEKIKENITPKALEWVKGNVPNVRRYLESMIEAQIAELKNSNRK